MLKLTLFFRPLFFLILPTVCTITDAKPLRPVPAIICDESEHIFGSAPNTEVVNHDFILTNEGVISLHISAVRADCGCVLTRLAKDVLAPGESTSLRVKFDLKGRAGRQMRRIIVESNDPAQPRLVLALIGEALASMEVIPDRIYWGNIHFAAPVEKSCEIRFHEGDESYVYSVTSPDSSFAVELTTVKPRRIYKVVIRAVPPLRPGSFQSALRVRTDHPRFQTLEIPMQGRIVGDIFSIPEEIFIESSDKDKKESKITRALLVYSGLKKKFKILKLEVPTPEIKATVRSMKMGGGYRIDLRNITPSQDLDGASVVIVTDSETMPVISVPIRVPDPDNP